MNFKIASSPEEEKPETPAETPATTLTKPPEAAPPTPPPAAPPPAAPASPGAKSEGSDPEPEDEKPTGIVEKITEAAGPILEHHRKKIFFGGGVLVLLGALIIGWYNVLYPAMLLKSGEDLMTAGEYEQVRRYIAAYHETGKSNDESKLLLARALLFTGDPSGAREAIGDAPLEDPELRYIHALGGFAEDPQEAAVQLDLIRFDDGAPSYVVVARGVLAMFGGNSAAAAAAFAKTRDIETQPDDLTERHLRALFNILVDNLQPRIKSEAELTFTLPKAQGKITNSRVTSGLEGFEHNFSIPFNASALDHDINATSVQDFIRGLELLADTQNATDSADEIIEARSDAFGSLLGQFVAAYYHVKKGRFVEAADIYRSIRTADLDNSLASQYEGTAFWLSQEGALPDPRVLDAYESAIESNPKNSVALNNLAFLNLNLGEIEKAKKLIDLAAAIDNVNPHIVFNILVIDVVNGSTDFEHSLTRIESLVGKWPNSIAVLELASEISILSQLSSSAVSYLEQIMERAPSVKHAVRIADLYRHNGQFRVAISELQKAHELFPHNNDLTGLIALYYAKSGDYNTASETMRKYKLPAGGQLGLYIRAIATDDIEAGEEAFNLALPSHKTDIAMELTRIHLRNKDTKLAVQTLQRARDHAEVSNQLDLVLSLESLQLRLESEDDDSFQLGEKVDDLASRVSKSENATALLDLVWTYYNIGIYQAGIDLLSIIRRQPARLPLLRKALLIGHENLGNTDDVARIKGEVYDDIVEAESGLSFEKYETRLSLLKAINSAVRGQEYELALGLYQGLTTGKFFDPQKAAVDHQNRGALHLALHNFEMAVADFRKGIKLAVNEEQREAIHYNYVQALVQTKDYTVAENEINQSIKTAGPDFKHLRAYERLFAGVLFFQEKYDRARTLYLSLISKYPRDPSNYIGIANIEMRREDFKSAINILVDGLDIAPDNINIHRLIQNAYHRLGRINEAERHKKIIENIQKSS